MRRLLHPMLHAGLLVLGVAACGGGGGGGDETPPPIQPPQALAELTLHAGSLLAGGCDTKDGVGSEARLNKPGPLAIDGSGSIHFVDTYWGRMRVLDPQGRVSTTTVPSNIPVEEAGGLRYFPMIPGIAFGADGSRYFAARNDLRLPPDYTRDPKGWVILRASGDGPIGLYADPARQAQPIEVGNTISAMALDSQGRLLVADTEACAVRRVELDRSVSTLFTTESVSDGYSTRCLWVHALAVDGNDELAFVLGDGTLRRRSAAGTERTVAGVTASSYLGNYLPNYHLYLAFDSQGRLLISEGGAQRVRALSADGTLSVLASNPGGPERPRP